MSYILEALRRAEAEREASSGARQGLHAPPPPHAAGVQRSRWPLLIALSLGLLLAAGLGAWLARPGTPAPAPAPAPAATPAPPEWPKARLEEPPAAPARPSPAPLQAVSATSAAPAAPVAPTRAVEAPEPPPPRLAELPAAIRQQLPPLQVGGSMHSPEPALRSLILNGQLYREGDALGPDLRLERIDARSALLRFKGQAFVLSF